MVSSQPGHQLTLCRGYVPTIDDALQFFERATIKTKKIITTVRMNIGGKTYLNLQELEPDASDCIDDNALGYYRSGSESETTLQANIQQFQRYLFVPRMLINVADVSTECTILGRRASLPLMIAPMAMQKLAHPDGERGMARAASLHTIPMILSTMSTTSMDDVADATSSDLYFQLYCLKDKTVTASMIQHAERLGYKGIVITVDAPRLGKRESDERHRFTLPEHLRLEILQKHGIGSQTSDSTLQSRFGSEFSTLIDDSLTWDVISFVRNITTLPIILKGILSAEDARLAVKHKVNAIVVSNHGGRQLDYAIPTLQALEQIVPAVKGRVEIWVDGGVRRGTDLVKCLCLGADAVLIGRPFLWALSLGGEDGVAQAIRMMQQDVERTMCLMGVTRPHHLYRGTRAFPFGKHPSFLTYSRVK